MRDIGEIRPNHTAAYRLTINTIYSVYVVTLKQMWNNSSCGKVCCGKCTPPVNESQSLLSSSPTEDVADNVAGCVPFRCAPSAVCIKSKAVCLIFLWSIFFGGFYYILRSISLFMSFWIPKFDSLLPLLVFYICRAILNFSFPLSGYIADVHCGRLKIILFSMILMCCSALILLPCNIIYYTTSLNSSRIYRIIYYIVNSFTLVFGHITIAGYYANFIQFGLDQLLEAPSHHQALYVHWAKWCLDLMSIIIVPCGIMDNTNQIIQLTFIMITRILLIIIVVLFFLLCVFSYWKRHWFYTDFGHHNPYKMVFKVLNFARKHKYPLQRSAFTYCDDERPSRLDFCKERFGGPFTTEQVEDVKTFLKIVLVLMCIGPIFVMDLPAENNIMYYFEVHLGAPLEFRWISIIVNGGFLKSILSTIFLPIYMWITFSVMRNRVPSILRRLGFGIVVYFLGIVSFFMLDIYGHSHDNRECIWVIPCEINTKNGHMSQISLKLLAHIVYVEE